MINEIKTIVQNYLNNIKLCGLIQGIVYPEGIKVSDKLTIPNELIKGNLKSHVAAGDKVRLFQNHGGQEFYIVEIIGLDFAEMTVEIEPISITGTNQSINSIKIKRVIR